MDIYFSPFMFILSYHLSLFYVYFFSIAPILVACEESQAVTIEMRKLGHEAYSCDIQVDNSQGNRQKKEKIVDKKFK